MKLQVKFLAALLLTLFSCDRYPQDPNATYENIKGGVFLVGLVENSPFVHYSTGDTSGIEVELVRQFAREHNANIQWVTGSEGVLMDKLENFEVHIVIGGLKETTPYTASIGITRPYHRDFVMAVPQGENAFLIELEKFLKSRELEIKKDFANHDG